MQSIKDTQAFMGKNITQSKMEPTTLEHVLELIRTSSSLKGKIEQVRSIDEQGQRQEAKKALLPYFSLNVFEGNSRSNENFRSSSHIVIDFDHVPPDRLADTIAKLQIDPRVQAYFVSPSSDGIKIIFPLQQVITDAKFFTNYYIEAAEKISQDYDLKADPSCKDPARAVFLTYDPHVFVRDEKDITPLPVVLPKGGTLRGRPPAQKIGTAIPEALLSMFEPASPGERTHKMTQIIGLSINHGMSRELTLQYLKLWNEKNNPPHDEKKLIDTVNDMYARYKKVDLPFDIIERGNQYYRFSLGDPEKKEKLLSTFIIEPESLLRAKEGDVLTCTIVTSSGNKYTEILFEATDWTPEGLEKRIGHIDCTVLATEMEVKIMKMYIEARIPVTKIGTRVVGLDDSNSLWISKNLNMDKTGILPVMTHVPYDRGGDSFYNKIEYVFQNDDEYMKHIGTFYDLILKINDPQAIVPMLGWIFVTPVRKVIMEYKKKFPVLFVPGTMGSGKTSTAQLFMRLCGYKSDDINSADMRRFPMLKALSSTNGIPIFIDEFKQSDMTDFSTNDIHRYIRKSTDGGVEPKGHSDQTTTDYHLLAPWVLIGEWSIKTPAERERMIIPRFSAQIKLDKSMQKYFLKLFNETELRGFMVKYIPYLLGQDIRKRYDEAHVYCENHFKKIQVAPRVLHNLVIMTMGVKLFIDYAAYLKLPVPAIDLPAILNGQLSEITGTNTGAVESAIDQLIGEMSRMSIREKHNSSGVSTVNTKEPWYTVSEFNGKAALCIRFSLALPLVKEFAKRTDSEIDILDASGYRRMLSPKETPYLLSASHPVKFGGGRLYRCVIFDMDQARAAGVDLEGFEDA